MIAEVRARFFNSIMMGIILGLIYYNQGDSQQSAKNLLGLFFILTMYQVMISMFSVLQVFPADVKVFMRENLSGANRVSSYFLARLLAEIPNNIIYPIIMASIVYGMAGLQVNARRFYLFNLIQVQAARAWGEGGGRSSQPAVKRGEGSSLHPDSVAVLCCVNLCRCWWLTPPCRWAT